MGRMNLIPAMAMAALLGAADTAAGAVPQALGHARAAREYRAAAEAESLYPQDPADSLYRAAREYLNRSNYREAARMFQRVYERYPRSAYAAQSLYYQAFALYRQGGERYLRAAREALGRLREEYGDSEVARRDAQSLAARIEGQLARRGDREAAEATAIRAAEIEEERHEEERHEEERGEEERRQEHSRQERSGCRGEDEIRMHALNALLQMSSEQALPIIERVLANRDDDPCSVEMRRHAVFLLAQHVDEESVDILLDLVRDDPDREVRGNAVFWLSQVPGERTVDALQDILMESDDFEMQEKAIFALSQSGSERAGQVLRDYAMQEDAPAELRANAIFWLGQRRGNAQFLRDIYESTSELEIKEKIIFSLAQEGGEGNARWLLDIAGDAEEPMEMREKAVFWVGQSRRVPVEEIGGLYDVMPERELKEQVIFALSQRHEDAAVDKLLDIARNETDPELRKRAIFWLSQSKDPRVVEFLMEIIEGR